MRDRNYPEQLLDEFLRIDGEWRKLIDEGNHLKYERNRASETVPKLKGEEKQKVIGEMRRISDRKIGTKSATVMVAASAVM